jgi:alcohol dehydrogenase YqhD (iron-dependent ADH family)
LPTERALPLSGELGKVCLQRGCLPFCAFAEKIFGITDPDAGKAALDGREAMENFFRSISMPVSIKELGVDLTDTQIDELARKGSRDDSRTLGSFKTLRRGDIKKIYEMAR